MKVSEQVNNGKKLDRVVELLEQGIKDNKRREVKDDARHRASKYLGVISGALKMIQWSIIVYLTYIGIAYYPEETIQLLRQARENVGL